MALTRTDRIQSNSGTNHGTGSFASGSFTPSNSSLLYVVVFAIEQNDSGMRGTDLTITDSVGLSWTSRAATTASPAWSYGIRVWTAPVTTGQSMTVTADCGAFDIQGYRIEAYDFTDYDTSTPIGATVVGSDADGNGPLQLTLSGAPESSSIVMAHLATGVSATPATATPNAAWTELYDTVHTNWLIRQTQLRTGSTSTAVDWDDVCATGTPFGGATACAVEIRQASQAPPITDGPRLHAVRSNLRLN